MYGIDTSIYIPWRSKSIENDVSTRNSLMVPIVLSVLYNVVYISKIVVYKTFDKQLNLSERIKSVNINHKILLHIMKKYEPLLHPGENPVCDNCPSGHGSSVPKKML